MVEDVVEYFRQEISTPTTLLVSGLLVDYRFVEAFERETNQTIFLLQGFGSGWEGSAETALYFVERGYNVLLLSLPGYGNSQGFSGVVHQKDFSMEAEIVCNFLDQFCKTKGGASFLFHFIGHSMGATVCVQAIQICPQIAKSITLLTPANMYRDHWTMALRFVWSGTWTVVKHFSHYQRSHIKQPQKSCWTRGRWRQRLLEWRRLQIDSLTPLVNDISRELPVYFVFGGQDRLFRFARARKFLRDIHRMDGGYIHPEFHHNPMIAHAREVVDVFCDLQNNESSV